MVIITTLSSSPSYESMSVKSAICSRKSESVGSSFSSSYCEIFEANSFTFSILSIPSSPSASRAAIYPVFSSISSKSSEILSSSACSVSISIILQNPLSFAAALDIPA